MLVKMTDKKEDYPLLWFGTKERLKEIINNNLEREE